ncbi:MAG: glutamate 5-kinase, partial [Candidatus Omnitrophica bacterium]|nr:glutamate 5-kinase [Candidatus Omnitrophota bacterium]
MQLHKNYKRVVVKVGSSLFYAAKKLDTAYFHKIAAQISDLIKNENKEIILVSSGAIALGMDLLKMGSRPKKLSLLQAVAAVGQNSLMDKYNKEFSGYGINCAQVLLTYEDFCSRSRYLNAKHTLLELLKLGYVPIINENDTISTDEIKFGDNDLLSALVAKLAGADLLVLLSDVDGLLDRDNKVIPVIDEINAQVKSLAYSTKNRTSVGGMITKIGAANMAVKSGVPCVIANGRTENIIPSLVRRPESSGTLFVSKKSLSAKEHWMAFGTKPKGRILVDEGARKALVDKKSLLSVGIVSCSGHFSGGDIVSICDNREVEFARGKAGLA